MCIVIWWERCVKYFRYWLDDWNIHLLLINSMCDSYFRGLNATTFSAEHVGQTPQVIRDQLSQNVKDIIERRGGVCAMLVDFIAIIQNIEDVVSETMFHNGEDHRWIVISYMLHRHWDFQCTRWTFWLIILRMKTDSWCRFLQYERRLLSSESRFFQEGSSPEYRADGR